MNYIPITIIILLIFAGIIAMVMNMTRRSEKSTRINAAKFRATTAVKSQPTRASPEYHAEATPDGVNVLVTDALTDEQAHILSKIFEDDSMYTASPDHHWKTTEPSPLERE